MFTLVYSHKSETGYSAPWEGRILDIPGAVAGVETLDINGYSDTLYAVVRGGSARRRLSPADRQWLKACWYDAGCPDLNPRDAAVKQYMQALKAALRGESGAIKMMRSAQARLRIVFG
jgi:hypothetical protein